MNNKILLLIIGLMLLLVSSITFATNLTNVHYNMTTGANTQSTGTYYYYQQFKANTTSINNMQWDLENSAGRTGSIKFHLYADTGANDFTVNGKLYDFPETINISKIPASYILVEINTTSYDSLVVGTKYWIIYNATASGAFNQRVNAGAGTYYCDSGGGGLTDAKRLTSCHNAIFGYYYSNLLTINSINLTANYPSGGYTNDTIYVGAQNLSVRANVTGTTNITYNISNNGIQVSNTSQWLTFNANAGDNITITIIATNLSLVPSTVILSKTYTVFGSVFNYAPTGNNWNMNNLSIINGLKYNLSINITFAQQDLFATFLDVTCDISGSIFNATNTTINTSTLKYYINNISLNYPMQRCRIYMTSSDSHTAQKIPVYRKTNLNNGIVFDTNISEIQILSNDADYSNIKTKQLLDRETFEFEYNEKSLMRSYTVHSDNKLYYLSNSQYKGHFVSWNDITHTGNWIDFEQDNSNAYDYNIEKIDDYTYNVIVSPIIPEDESEIEINKKGLLSFLGIGEDQTIEEAKLDNFGIDNIKFQSLGNTNIYNSTYYFYIGGQINVTSFNKYDNGGINNFTAIVTTISAYPAYNSIVNITTDNGIIDNITNGTYRINLTNAFFMDNIKLVNLTNTSLAVLYNSSQGQLNINVVDLLIGNPIINFTTNFKNSINNYLTQNNVTGTSYVTLYLNATTYDYNVTGPGYLTAIGTQIMNYKDNLSLTVSMGYIANFTIYDEVTGQLFNMGDAKNPTLMIYCPTSNIVFNLTSNAFTIPITCAYTKFQLQMFFNNTLTTPIYRTYIIPPTALQMIKVYFANGQTTPLVNIVFQISDISSQYPAAGIYVNRYINTTYATISADYTDIENKVGTFLIQNVYYNVDLYSNGIFSKNLGAFLADYSGTKTISINTINLLPYQTTSNIPLVSYTAYNQSGSLMINATYYDPSATTTTAQFVILQGTNMIEGTLLYNKTYTNTSNLTISYNASAYVNLSLYAYFNYVQTTTPTTIQTTPGSNVWNSINGIDFPLIGILGTKIMSIVILVILIIITLYATMSNAIEMTLIVSCIGLLFTIFGWFGTNSVTMKSVMILLVIINIISVVRKANKRSDVIQ
jgi:hypothetical protein